MSKEAIKPKSEPLPVNQKPEVFGYSTASIVSAAAASGYYLDLASSDLSVSPTDLLSGGGIVYLAGATGYAALKAHRETKEYNGASDEERNAEPALKRKLSVQGLRTFYWGASAALLAEVSVIEAINFVQADGEKGLTAAISVVAAGGAGKAISGMRKSRGKSMGIKAQLETD
jgi:hypothetical protein